MKRQKQFQTIVLLSVFLLFGGYANAQQEVTGLFGGKTKERKTNVQQTWEIPITKYGNGQAKLVVIKAGKKMKSAQQVGTKAYYETGQMQREVMPDNKGKYVEKYYYPNGQLAKIRPSDSPRGGLSEGECKSYYSNGQLWQVGKFSASYSTKEDYKEYYSTGILKATGKTVGFGKAVGVWTFYNEDGEVAKTEDFGEGRKLTRTGIDEENKKYDLLD